jgi:tRNA (cmo5U34)-methyltransferase
VKSTVKEIRAPFDADVERFSNLETGQAEQVDAPLMMELLTQAAVSVTPHAARIVDVGSGAGNYSLKILGFLSEWRGHTAAEAAVPGEVEVTLIDLSRPMLDRAVQRIGEAQPQVCTVDV